MKLRVFYIDDEIELCDIFSELFVSDDVEIITFIDPQLAIISALQSPPDLVFIDYRLHGVTGDKVALDMKCNSPFYLISGDLIVTTDFKFEKILSKPVASTEIRKIIFHHMVEKNNKK